MYRSGKRIKNYVLQEKIGEGGFGSIYLANQDIIEREVAIKIAHEHHRNEPVFIRRFLYEVKISASLEHPNIIPIYDYWRDQHGAYMVMRLMPDNLSNYLSNRTMVDLPRIAKWLYQISSALELAHAHGIVHKDIKPDNILLDQFDNAYLTDFGIATLEKDDGRYSQFGSLGYMAPEQVKRDTITRRSDIYSLGVLLHNIITNELTFNERFTDILTSTLFQPLSSVRTYYPQLPSALDRVIEKATAKKPQNRYSNVREFSREFAAIVDKYELRYLPLQGPHIQNDDDTLFMKKGSVSETQDVISLDNNYFVTMDMELTDTGLPVNSTMHSSSSLTETGIQTDQNFTSPQFITPETGKLWNPYKGLQSFSEVDAALFFGRDRWINKLQNLLTSDNSPTRLIVLTGASGSGKSSLVKAGLMPRIANQAFLRSEQWHAESIVPTNQPISDIVQVLQSMLPQPPDIPISRQLSESVDALHRIVLAIVQYLNLSDFVLFIDQFETYFNRGVDSKEQHILLENLHYAISTSDSRLRLIVTLRSDFLEMPLTHPTFGESARNNLYVIDRPDVTELTDMIVQPAQAVGVTVERALVDTLVAEFKTSVSSLPLLQYVLRELFAISKESTLTYQSYLDSGGLYGTLTRRAEKIYHEFSVEEQSQVRRVFLQLVNVQEDGTYTSRRALFADVIATGDVAIIRHVIRVLGEHRLLIFDNAPDTREPTIQIVHEVMLEHWETLRGWLDDARSALLMRQKFATYVSAWVTNNRHSDYLVGGLQLARFEGLQNQELFVLNPTEYEFFYQSVQQRQRQRLIIVGSILVLIILLLFSSVMAVLAVNRQQVAELALRESQSREFAMRASTDRSRLDARIQWAVESYETAKTLESYESLLRMSQENPRLTTFLQHHYAVRAVAVNAAGTRAITGGTDGWLRLWNLESFELIGETQISSQQTIHAVEYNSTTQQLAVVADTTLSIWSIDGGLTELQSIHFDTGQLFDVSYNAEGTIVATADESGAIRIWDTTSLNAGSKIVTEHNGEAFAITFHPEKNIIASGGADDRIMLIDLDTNTLTELNGHNNWVLTLDFSSDGSVLVSAGVDPNVLLWDTRTGQRLANLSTGHSGWIRDVELSSDLALLLTVSQDNSARLWDVRSGQPIGEPFRGHVDGLWDAAFLSEGTSFITASGDQSAAMWSINPSQKIGLAIGQQDETIWESAFALDGSIFATGGGNVQNGVDFDIYLWDTNGELLARLSDGTQAVVTELIISDENILAAGYANGDVNLWNVNDPRNPTTLNRKNIHSSSVQFIYYDNTQDRFFSVEENGVVYTWLSHDLQLQSELIVSTDVNVTVADYYDGWLALGTASGEIILSDVDGERIKSVTHGSHIESLAISHDGKWLTTGGRDGRIHVWSLHAILNDDPKEQHILDFHTNWVTDLGFIGNPNWLVSVSRDNTLVIWDIETGQPIEPALVGHDGWINTVAIDPSGKYLVSAGWDQMIWLWQIDPDKWVQTICQIANLSQTSC